MIPDDFARIESALNIALPGAYRGLLTPFPLPAFASNSDTALWDDPDRLIELNGELRSGTAGVKPWPAHFYALGRDAGGCSQAIDLRDGSLWWMDRGHVDAPDSYRHAESLVDWAKAHFAGLGEDLAGEGGDPAASPRDRASVEDRNARASARFSASLLVIIVLAAAGAVLLWKLVRD